MCTEIVPLDPARRITTAEGIEPSESGDGDFDEMVERAELEEADRKADRDLAEVLAIPWERPEETPKPPPPPTAAERRAALRVSLGSLAPDWAIELGATSEGKAFEGDAGELLRDAVSMAIFTDRGPVLRRLADHLLGRQVDRFLVLALLHGWAAYFCAPCPFEAEVAAIVADAARAR